jgi:hypothetical protein
MERYELKGYDPFPLSMGESRVLGDFTLSFAKKTIPPTQTHGRYPYKIPEQTICFFSVRDSVTGDARMSELDLGWEVNTGRVDAGVETLDSMKAILAVRKRYTRRGTLFAFQKKKTNTSGRARYGYRDRRTDGTSNSGDITTGRMPYGEEFIDDGDDFIERFAIELTKDNEEWKKDRRTKRKAGELKKGAFSDVEDAIRTKELMVTLPQLADLESALATLIGKGDNYTRSQVEDVMKTMNKVEDGSKKLLSLKKWAR